MRDNKTKKLALCAMIAAIYTALCTVLAPFSYGMMQVRVSEALTLLPVFSPLGVWGVTLGCALSNLVGFFTGANPLGYMDIFFGTAATLIAALLSRKLRHIRWFGLPVLSAVPPVLINAAVIGAELAVVTVPAEAFWGAFLINALWVALGQAISCFALGLPLVYVMQKTGVYKYLKD